MRKAIAILFLTLFTFSSTEAGQLLKLPLLFHHLDEHLSDGRSDSVYDFLVEHYTGDHDDDFDRDEDQQLPFKTINTASFGSIFLVPEHPELEACCHFISNAFHSYAADPGLSNYYAEIFHPPSKV